MASFRILRAFGFLILALGSCSPVSPTVPALRLLDLRPRQLVGVYLNEPLVLHFSSELDSASITSQSVRIVTREGEKAHGSRFVVGRELTFVPDPVRAPDLKDGGYLPNTTYQLELAGFPRADAIRGHDGACLASTLRIEFHTVAIDNQGTGYVFLDDSPDRVGPLRIQPNKPSNSQPVRKQITAQAGLDLEGEEPIDPSTISDDVFSLVRDDEHAKGPEYRLRAVLIDNHNKYAYFSRGKTTLLRLLPDTVVPSGIYRLQIDASKLQIRDFGRHLVPVIGKEALRNLRIKVDQQSDQIESEYLEHFLDSDKRSSALVPGADGAALWSNTGAVQIRFPAAAGDGSDADVSDVNLPAMAVKKHVQAASFSVPLNFSCAIDVGDGMCRLCSQGALEIAGHLRRAGSVRTEALPKFLAGDTLSNWLERQVDAALPLTVLIAGGDLRISGELEVPGPLLLVAGGRVIVSGRIIVAGSEPIGTSFLSRHDPLDSKHVVPLGEGGAIAIWAGAQAGRVPNAADALLFLDPPKQNPLVRPLTYAVRSNPIPAEGRAKNWLPAEGPWGRPGTGSMRVRYAGQRRYADAAGDYEVVVDDPALLVDCPTLSVLIELSVPAASGEQPWNPPTLDTVRVRWEIDR